MNNKERFHAVMNYQPYDRLPIAHFGFWYETLVKWAEEGHIDKEIVPMVSDGNEYDQAVAEKLGFDFNYFDVYSYGNSLFPYFEVELLRERPDGFKEYRNSFGAIELVRDGANSIRAEVGYTLTDRKSFEKEFLPRLTFSENRLNKPELEKLKAENDTRQNPLGLHSGSMLGDFRNWVGFENLAYLYVDDEELYDDIINTVGDLSYQYTKAVLDTGVKFDFIHFWEDICFKNGPMINPSVFAKKIGPHYKRITDLAKSYDVSLVSVDCDGMIDALVDIWLENGITTMFPIEFGTWQGNIGNFKKKWGTQIRGVGGMNKNVFALEHADIDKEIDRLKPLIEMGGYIPCPDHRIPPNAKWKNVVYFTDKMKHLF